MNWSACSTAGPPILALIALGRRVGDSHPPPPFSGDGGGGENSGGEGKGDAGRSRGRLPLFRRSFCAAISREEWFACWLRKTYVNHPFLLKNKGFWSQKSGIPLLTSHPTSGIM